MSLKKALTGASVLAVAVAIAAPAAQAAAPATTLFGGGGTLAAKLYRDVFNCYSAKTYGIYGTSAGNPVGASYPTALNAKCTTEANVDEALAYEPVGSGAGLSAFTTGTPSYFGSPASSNPVAYLNTAATVGASATPYPEVVFAGSDAFLSPTQISAANAIDGGAAIFQIPSLATPITLPVGQVSGVSLSLANVCDIFSGQALVPNNKAKSQEVVVRSDGSGTSAIFGLWLQQNCLGTGAQGKSYSFLAANGFGTTSPTWSTAFVGTLGTPTAVSGSGGVAATVASASFSIGYLSPDYDYPIVATSKAYSAKVNGVTTAIANVTTHLNAVAIPTKYVNTIGQTLNTASTAKSLSTTGYPIVGFTFIDTYGCYSSTYAGGAIGSAAQGTQLKTLLTDIYSSGTFATEAAAIINASGFVQPTVALVNLYHSAGGPLSTTGINGTQCPSGRT
jgi:hypothetical protein